VHIAIVLLGTATMPRRCTQHKVSVVPRWATNTRPSTVCDSHVKQVKLSHPDLPFERLQVFNLSCKRI